MAPSEKTFLFATGGVNTAGSGREAFVTRLERRGGILQKKVKWQHVSYPRELTPGNRIIKRIEGSRINQVVKSLEENNNRI